MKPWLITLNSVLLCASIAIPTSGQTPMWDALTKCEYQIDTADVRVLKVEIDNLDFFRDNEYNTCLRKGYSLPGLWVQPKLRYVPMKNILIEAGLHAFILNGANKYPNYVYHDIGTWKGNQYQKGAHILPWFRVQGKIKNLNVILGDIYGGSNHELSEPLFNTETNLSQDPEMGVQLIWDTSYLHADTWVNWQSYIFEEDSHQEAFTVGGNWRWMYNSNQNKCHFYTPMQVVIQHRGGEQDTTHLGVQTICNGSLGFGVRYNYQKKTLKQVGAEANLLGCWQQSGNLWSFDTGYALHGTVHGNLWNHLGLRAGYYYVPKHFVSLYGNPFFSTLSLKDATNYRRMHTAYLRADYHYTFAHDYVCGAEVEAYETWLPQRNEFNLSFGIYFRVHPTFVLKKWR